MESLTDFENVGLFDMRYRAFLETITQVRPRLHRYCARMLGSVMDGEDLVQEALFQAYRKLEMFDDSRPLTPWLFRIAHNLCIDALRRRGVRDDAEHRAVVDESIDPIEPAGRAVTRAIEYLVLTLPPKERACVLLKDVLDYSLEEIAELVDSSVGGVKAALNRGRRKLAAPEARPAQPRQAGADATRLMRLYCERFNRHDWDAVRELISADARLLFPNGYAGRLAGSPYFSKYDETEFGWRMAVGQVDGEPAIIRLREEAAGWTPDSVIRLEWDDTHVIRITDYHWCPWVLAAAASVSVEST
jgi:RNA polymerase sigma-70 factor (ECF subfamily)